MPPHAPHAPLIPPLPVRPERVRVQDELGRARTLDTSPNAYARLFASASALTTPSIMLLLGIGPQLDLVTTLLTTQHATTITDIFYVECPEFSTQLPPARTLPPHWHALTPSEALHRMRTWHHNARAWAIWSYTPETRLFSRFWGPVLGYILTQGWKYSLENTKSHVRTNETSRASAGVGAETGVHAGAGGGVSAGVGMRVGVNSDGSTDSEDGDSNADSGAGTGLYANEGTRVGREVDTQRIGVVKGAKANSTAPSARTGERTNTLRRGGEQPSRTILIPGHAHGLLSTELASGFAAHGFTPLFVPVEPDACLKIALAHLQNERPALFFAINLQGFDPEGLLFQALKACNVPIGTWFVDNPWHVLSQLRAPWWQELALFVSDASFIAELQHGAGVNARVVHLPLAAWFTNTVPAHAASPHATSSHAYEVSSPLVFVGRSAFPQRDSFFAGCRLPAPLLDAAKARLTSFPLPDVRWWGQQLGITQWWPGSTCRQAGFGAERCSMERRALWLRTASTLGLTVYGDDAWKTLLPATVCVRAPVDYYSALPHIYAAASYSLNVTSLLLPAGLTQRHFDVWMAGGLLLTDATPGLALFPTELTEPISLNSPDALPATLERFERDPLLRPHLQQAWQTLLHAQHTYPHRAATILARTGLLV